MEIRKGYTENVKKTVCKGYRNQLTQTETTISVRRNSNNTAYYQQVQDKLESIKKLLQPRNRNNYQQSKKLNSKTEEAIPIIQRMLVTRSLIAYSSRLQ